MGLALLLLIQAQLRSYPGISVLCCPQELLQNQRKGRMTQVNKSLFSTDKISTLVDSL